MQSENMQKLKKASLLDLFLGKSEAQDSKKQETILANMSNRIEELKNNFFSFFSKQNSESLRMRLETISAAQEIKILAQLESKLTENCSSEDLSCLLTRLGSFKFSEKNFENRERMQKVMEQVVDRSILATQSLIQLALRYHLKKSDSLTQAILLSLSRRHCPVSEFLSFDSLSCSIDHLVSFYLLVERSFECTRLAERHEFFCQVLAQNESDLTSESAKTLYRMAERIIQSCIATSQKAPLAAFLKSMAPLHSRHPLNDIFFNKALDFIHKKEASFDFAELILTGMKDMKVELTLVTYNTLLDIYFSQGQINYAWALFKQIQRSSSVIADSYSYTIMINGVKNQFKSTSNLNTAARRCPKNGGQMDKSGANSERLFQIFELFNEFKKRFKPDSIICNSVLDACVSLGAWDKAREVLGEMSHSKDSTQADEVSYNTLIAGACKENNVKEALSFYSEMRDKKLSPNIVTFNCLIDVCMKSKRLDQAWSFLNKMREEGVECDNYTFSILTNGVKSNYKSKAEFLRLWDLLESLKQGPGFKPDEIFYNSIMDACVKFDEVQKAENLFNEMKMMGVKPSACTYGVLIKGHGKGMNLKKGMQLFEEMKGNGVAPNEITFGCLIDACVKNNRMDMAQQLVSRMRTEGLKVNTIMLTSLVKGLARSRQFAEARRVLKDMESSPDSKPNVITFNCLIDAYIKAEKFADALESFKEMQGMDIKPDAITFSTLIKGHCMNGSVSTAVELLKQMIKNKQVLDDSLFNYVMDFCSNEKNYQEGISFFGLMLSQTGITPTVHTYGVLAKLYGIGKMVDESLELLDRMEKMGIKLSVIVCTSVVQTCFNARHPKKAWSVYQRMRQANVQTDTIFVAKMIKGLSRSHWNKESYEVFCDSKESRFNLSPEILKCLIAGLEKDKREKNSEKIEDVSAYLANQNRLPVSHKQEKEEKPYTMILDKENSSNGQGYKKDKNTKKEWIYTQKNQGRVLGENKGGFQNAPKAQIDLFSGKNNYKKETNGKGTVTMGFNREIFGSKQTKSQQKTPISPLNPMTPIEFSRKIL